MRDVVLSVAFLAATLVLSADAQTSPQMGTWTEVPNNYPTDQNPTAVTVGQFVLNNRVVPTNTTVFLTCKKPIEGDPSLALKFSVPPFAAFNPSAMSKSASFAIDADKYTVPLDSFAVGTSDFFVISPDSSVAKRLASVKQGHAATMILSFQTMGQEAKFIAQLTKPVPPIMAVFKACNVIVSGSNFR